MNYTHPQTLSLATGNNAISYQERKKILGKKPTLQIPSLITIEYIDQILLGTTLVFEEVDQQGMIHSCTGLEHLYHLQQEPGSPAIYIMDNHHHALYFRLEILTKKPHQTYHVLHIDAHADLGTNPHQIQKDQLKDQTYRRNFVNHHCEIGNFITPFTQLGTVTQIRTSHTLEEVAQQKRPDQSIILDIDLDFRSLDQKIPSYQLTILRKLIQQSDLVTIATSPFFLEQSKALRFLQQLLQS